MPVERRLRTGLPGNAGAIDPAVERALDEAMAAGRRRRRYRHAAAAALVLGALLVAGASVPQLLRSSTRVPATGAATILAELQGTWSTGTVAGDEARADLEAAGVAACGSELLGTATALEWTLAIDGERFTVAVSADGSTAVEDRSGFVDVRPDGSVRLVEPDGPSTATFDARLDGDRLTLALVDVRAAGEDGPCEVRAEAIAQLGRPLARVG